VPGFMDHFFCNFILHLKKKFTHIFYIKGNISRQGKVVEAKKNTFLLQATRRKQAEVPGHIQEIAQR
jgi:hypothetical protein